MFSIDAVNSFSDQQFAFSNKQKLSIYAVYIKYELLF
jgi:hypothetical protein